MFCSMLPNRATVPPPFAGLAICLGVTYKTVLEWARNGARQQACVSKWSIGGRHKWRPAVAEATTAAAKHRFGPNRLAEIVLLGCSQHEPQFGEKALGRPVKTGASHNKNQNSPTWSLMKWPLWLGRAPPLNGSK